MMAERRTVPRVFGWVDSAQEPDLGVVVQAASACGLDSLVIPLAADATDADIVGMVRSCDAAALRLVLALDLRVLQSSESLVTENPSWFRGRVRLPPDPRLARGVPPDDGGTASVSVLAYAGDTFIDHWVKRLARWSDIGVLGALARPAALAPAGGWHALLPRLREASPECWIAVDARGATASDIDALAGCSFDAAVSSFGWWNGSDAWYFEEDARLRRCARTIIACLDASGGGSGNRRVAPAFVQLAARIAESALIDLELACDAGEAAVAATCRAFDSGQGFIAEWRPLLRTRRDGLAAVLVGRDDATPARVLLANLDEGNLAQLMVGDLVADSGVGRWALRDGTAVDAAAVLTLPPGESIELLASIPPAAKMQRPATPDRASAVAARIAIEQVTPTLDNGRFAVKRCVGERVVVEADVFADGHDQLAAAVLWRRSGEQTWIRTPMRALGNDRWAGMFQVDRCGRLEFIIEAWRDDFATLRDEIAKKLRANVLEAIDIADARALLDSVRLRSRTAAAPMKVLLAAFDSAEDDAARAQIVLSAVAASEVAAANDRPFSTRSAVFPIEVDRLRARYANWYELFPRSSPEADRHGTFDDVVDELPAICAMGFDVLYMPPIHPIGTSHRKGRNNALVAADGDPGSPYAIGAADGGHDAVHAELGGLEAFRRLVVAARALGMEIALDFAVQCSPDHPWLGEHRGWFAKRADGSIRHAENPPKKYEDIVNVDFYADSAIPALWNSLRDVVLFWAGEGVRTFRVDNPHTKPLPFWEWLIASVRCRFPDVLFLSEAFTRPKPMYRLGKLGFSQSYTYFIWRNDKAGLTQYLEELNRGDPRECLRPNFFVNTPDINPYELQNGGRAAHVIRAALAALLSGLWGVYAGFELCDAAALPGREEYLDSEKYQLRKRVRRRERDIVAEITTLNFLRRTNPELQTHLDIEFLHADNDRVLYFAKGPVDGASRLLIAISLDAVHPQTATIEVPLWRFGLADDAEIEVEALCPAASFRWRGKYQRIRLDPEHPFAVWRVFRLRRHVAEPAPENAA